MRGGDDRAVWFDFSIPDVVAYHHRLEVAQRRLLGVRLCPDSLQDSVVRYSEYNLVGCCTCSLSVPHFTYEEYHQRQD